MMVTFFNSTAQKARIISEDSSQILIKGLMVYTKTALPLLLMSALVSILFTLAQTKLLFTTKSMEFKFSRLNPLEGIKKMFSLRSLVELSKSVIKISILIYIIYSQLIARMIKIPRIMDLTMQQTLVFLGESIIAVVNTAGAIFLFVAAFDLFYQWWEYEKNIRMSKQDIKEEYKRTEGDPLIKGKIKEKQRQMAMSRMMQSVPEADVIIRNPTHYAVAIKYNNQTNKAPLVLAKGADHVALRIISVATAHDIMLTENKALARGLYESVELNQEIPEKFYQPVAEVLAYVYSLKKQEWR
jgi:flagellar biosynthetic protein FlhB